MLLLSCQTVALAVDVALSSLFLSCLAAILNLEKILLYEQHHFLSKCHLCCATLLLLCTKLH
jgi:hypothetical protein